jgi:hypothetical protein
MKKTTRCRFLLRDQCGQSIVEFAVVAPVFIVLILGFMQIAIWLFGTTLTEMAVREGCREGVAYYQPKPARWEGDSGGGRREPCEGDTATKTVAILMARKRTSEILSIAIIQRPFVILPQITEEDCAKGEEGTREMTIDAIVRLPVVVPFAADWIPGWFPGDIFVIHRKCRMRLERFYSY